jgi:outer membrane protein TolC
VLTPTLSFTGDGVAASPGSNRNTGVASLGLTVPLLRGRGGGLAWASERAAVASLDAARADFSHVRATSVLNAAIAYWGYVVATRTLSVLHESEDRARTLVQQTRTLIEADERPAAESISVTANLAAKRAARLAGEDAVATARQVLAEAMGLPVAELASLAPPVDSFPPTPDSATVTDWPADSTWIVVALRRRADLAAARKRRAATGNLVGATRNEVRSGFDLNVGAGFTGIDVGTGFGRLVSPFEGSAHRGFQTQVGLTYGMPLGNRAGQAQLQRSIAADRQAGIAADELARRIGLAVATSAATVRRTVEQLRLSEMAAALFARAIEAESEKFRLGTSTLFDVIIAQDNLTGARLSLINTQRRYAVAIAQLRFVTGTLVGDPACEPPDLDRIVTTDGGCPR